MANGSFILGGDFRGFFLGRLNLRDQDVADIVPMGYLPEGLMRILIGAVQMRTIHVEVGPRQTR